MKSFVIIFRQGPRQLNETELTRRQQEVSAWARTQNAAGHKLDPRILSPELLRPGIEKAADAWPVTALLFIEANDLTEAGRVAGSHPAKHFGASIEVRPWTSPIPAPALNKSADLIFGKRASHTGRTPVRGVTDFQTDGFPEKIVRSDGLEAET